MLRWHADSLAPAVLMMGHDLEQCSDTTQAAPKLAAATLFIPAEQALSADPAGALHSVAASTQLMDRDPKECSDTIQAAPKLATTVTAVFI